MGKHRRIWLATLVMAAAVVAVVWITFRRSEPSYDGKSLSDWVVAMRDGPDRENARKVMHLMGSNAWPMLLKWLRREDHATLKGAFYSFRYGMEEWMVRQKLLKPHSISSYRDAKASYLALGFLAFAELGPDGKAAIPALIHLLEVKRPNPDELSQAAGAASLILPYMSPYSIGPLIQALSSPDEQVRLLAAGTLGNIGTNASAAIPILQTWLHDKQLWTRLAASYDLGKMGGDPQVFVPVVITSLREWKMDTLDFQLEILTRFKSDARPAIPLLVSILTNTPNSLNWTNVFIRRKVMNALREIDPEAAAKAGVK